ncbi:MAG TPA: FAD-dependent monooxygenase, partial [Rhodothermales bacterium]
MSVDRQIVVVGGGLAGGLLSIMLRRRGYEVRVYERRSDSRKGVEYGGRSINLALSHRGLRALHRVGLAEAALERAIPMRGRQIHRASGGSEFQPYSPNAAEYINSISRAGLNELLLDQAEEEGVDIRFEHDCVAVDFEHRSVIVEDSRAGSRATVRDVVVFGTDGAGSVVRRSMEEQGLTMASSEFLDHGYKE